MNKDLLQQAIEHHQSGRLEEAKFIYDQILKSNPKHPDALHLRGLIALQSGDTRLAVEHLRKATQLQPKNWLFKGNLASALMETGDLETARTMFLRAAQLKPDAPQLHMGVANCYALLGKIADAEKQLRSITQRFPRFALAWFNLANTLRDQGDVRQAIEHYAHAVTLDPDLIEARNNLGASLLSLGQMEQAEAAYREALARRPDDVQLLCNLASVLIDRGQFADAETQCRHAISLAPDSATAFAFLGAAVGHQGRLLEALEIHRKAVALAPNDVRALTALGTALCETGNTAEGIPVLERAVELAPEIWQTRASLGTVHLAAGNFLQGWKGYYFRTGRTAFPKQFPGVQIASDLPLSLTGKKVCLLNEQGLGDQLFLLRWLPAIKARGAVVTYRPDAKLESILRGNSCVDQLVSSADRLPAADFNVMLGDLPYLACFDEEGQPLQAATAALVPASMPLAPRAENLAAMRERLQKLGPPPYIGLTWRGGTPPEAQAAVMSWMLYKEIPIQSLAGALRGIGGTFIALQRKPGAGEIDRLSELLQKPLHDLTDANEQLEDMLALLALLDDYVGVSNTNMHLRVAVGKRARVLVPCPPEWRWMAHGEESPWFPGFRVYRQKNDGDWNGALTDLEKDLLACFAETAGRGSPAKR